MISKVKLACKNMHRTERGMEIQDRESDVLERVVQRLLAEQRPEPKNFIQILRLRALLDINHVKGCQLTTTYLIFTYF